MKEIESYRLTMADQDNLPLLADLAYNELFTSAALNRKFYGIARSGIYRGFKYKIGSNLTLTVGDDSGQNTAYVERDGYCMTVQLQHPVQVTLPAGRKSAVVVEGFYKIGVVTRQVDSRSDVDSATMKVIPADQVADHHVVVCVVDVPANAKALTPEMISETGRVAGGIDIHSHIDVNKDPHKQYAMRNLKINTAAPLRGGRNLQGDVSLSIDTATTGRYGVVRLVDSTRSNSKTQPPTANALKNERARAETAENEIREHATTSAANAKKDAIAHADEVGSEAKEFATSEANKAKRESVAHADSVGREAQDFATAEASKAKRESVAHANKVAGEAKSHANNVASAAEERAKTHATNQANRAEKNAKDAAKAEGQAAKQHADSVSATAKREASSHADNVAKNAERAAKSFATSEAKAAESRANSFATTKANEAESRAKSHAQALIDRLLGGASSAYDTLKEIEDLIKGGDSAIGSITAQLANKLDKSATAVNSTKLEGKSKSQIVAEARSGLITESSAKNLAQSAESNAKKYADGKFQPKTDKLTNLVRSLWDTNAGQDLLCRGKRALVGMSTPDSGGLVVNYGNDFGKITLVGNTHASKIIASSIELGYAHGQDDSIGCKNWFRSSGDTGWFNGTYGGGIYMKDREWVRTYGGKKFHVDNTGLTAMYTKGGVQADRGFFWGDQSLDERYLKKGNLTDSMALNVADHAKLEVNAIANKNAEFWLTEDRRRHGFFIRYNGAGDNSIDFGTKNYELNEIKFMSVARGSKEVRFEATPKVGEHVIYHKGNKPTADEIGALPANSKKYARAYSSSYSFGGSSGDWTTEQFIAHLKQQGAFDQPYWMAKGSWSYASNKTISDTGCGRICLAGAVVEVMGLESAKTVRVTTATTATNNGLASAQFTYIDHGSSYAPGWRRDYNTTNKPNWKDVGGTHVIAEDSGHWQVSGKWLKAANANAGFLPAEAKQGGASVSKLGTSGWWFSEAWVNRYRGAIADLKTAYKLNGKNAVSHTGDEWLRINPEGNFSSGIYCGGTGTLRHDGNIQRNYWTASNAQIIRPSSDVGWGRPGNAAFSHNIENSAGAHWLLASYKNKGNDLRAGIQVLTSDEGAMRFYTHCRAKFVEINNGEIYAQGKRVFHEGYKPSPSDIGAAKVGGDKDQDFYAKALYLHSGTTDRAAIKTAIDGTSTHLDFSLTDDLNGNDRFRFRFTPTGGTGEYSIMELYEDNDAKDRKGKVDINGVLAVTDDIYEKGETLSNRYVNKNLLRDTYRNFTVDGDADTYYPVLFPSGSQAFNYMQLDISRCYNWTAPNTWNNSTHKGGLTLSIRWSGDTGWGGGDKDIRVDKFVETYSSMVGGLQLTVSGLVVWLRGGGAHYRMTSTNGRATQVMVYLGAYLSADKKEWHPRTDTSKVDDEIGPLYWNRNGSLFDHNNRVWSASNKPSPEQLGCLSTRGGSVVGNLHIGENRNHSFETSDSIATYRCDNETGWRLWMGGKKEGVDNTVLEAYTNGIVNVRGTLKEGGERVYSPRNKPTVDDIGAYAKNSKVADSEKLDGKDHSFFIFGDNQRGTLNGRADCNAINKSGFYWGSGAKNAPARVGSYIHVNHDTTDTVYGWQLWNNEQTNQLFVRAKTEGNFSSWAKVYTTTDKPTPDELGVAPHDKGNFAHHYCSAVMLLIPYVESDERFYESEVYGRLNFRRGFNTASERSESLIISAKSSYNINNFSMAKFSGLGRWNWCFCTVMYNGKKWLALQSGSNVQDVRWDFVGTRTVKASGYNPEDQFKVVPYRDSRTGTVNAEVEDSLEMIQSYRSMRDNLGGEFFSTNNKPTVNDVVGTVDFGRI